ncbi:hypothetical protein RIF29_18428 [Crotalaria pallida]|uniref:non-specific serine/threonine protein kinase n=1 Tax=Crotalaria pallida TaxID=3830 RepID=A0AAN9FIW6_CROPI
MPKTLLTLLAGAAALVAIVILLLWFYLSHIQRASRNSKTESPDPSEARRVELPIGNARHFEMEELSLATQNFTDTNLIGEGKLGKVYKGLLQDGLLVVIKKRRRFPSQEFVDEVRYLSSIQHPNLVTLLGYCQKNNLQFLVYEYVPNGSVSRHLYGPGQQLNNDKLDFKHRLSISLGAAKGGLAHLHSLSPTLVHKDFKTTNVLVDENFIIAKVADAALPNFLGRYEIAGPSSLVASDEIFLAPEVRKSRKFTDKSDVYSFGVFLLELLSGKAATESLSSGSNQNLVEWVLSNLDLPNMSKIIDQRLRGTFTTKGMEDFILLIISCLKPSSELRPTMSYVAMKLDQIFEKEMNSTAIMEDSTLTVTLGSQLFQAHT